MKINALFISTLTALSIAAVLPTHAVAQTAAAFEYIDIRWDGTDRMCVIFPDGRVEFVGKQLEAVPRPDDANKRAFYMTIETNRMAAQGYEVVSMISDEIIMKRAVAR